MGRELKRKEAKRQGKNVKEVQQENIDNKVTIKKFVIILIILMVLFILTYLFTGIFATKDIKWFSKNNESEEENISNISNKILASESLKQSEEDYYVYFYDVTKENVEVSNVINYLTNTVYRVDLHDAFNSNFIGEPSGIVDEIENLKVTDPTVIKVSSEKIVSFYSGTEEITSSLK